MEKMQHMPQPLLGFPPIPSGSVPVGAIVPFAGALGTPKPDSASPPTSVTDDKPYLTDPIEAWGWMLCDGRGLPCSQYPEMFLVLGYRYGGSGDTFKIPDYRGYFLRGCDAGSGNDPDQDKRTTPGTGSREEVGSVQQDALQCHRHSYTEPGGTYSAMAEGSTVVMNATPNQCTGYPDESSCDDGVNTSKFETRPKNIYVNYLIKFTYGP